jgi:hypothetical protein
MAGISAKIRLSEICPCQSLRLPYRAAGRCFFDPESRNPNRLRLISFRLARTRADARLRGCSPFAPMRRSRRQIIHIGMSKDEECQYSGASIAAVE